MAIRVEKQDIRGNRMDGCWAIQDERLYIGVNG